MRRIFVALFFFIASPIVQAAQVERELEGVKRKIEKEKQGITSVQRKEDSVLKNMEKIEEALDRKNQELKGINSSLESILADLQRREDAAKQISLSLGTRKELLKRRATALYKWLRGGSPLILLNGAFSVARLMQGKRYLESTLAYDRNLVSSLHAEAGRLETLKQELAQKREEVDRQRKNLVEVKESIRLEKEKKQVILSSLRKEKEARVRALKELEQAAQRLQKMMDDISRNAVGSFKPSPSGAGFDLLKGKLDFPVRGEVMGEFGKTKHPEFSAEVFHNGIDIEALYGEKITAVERGKVVFADRFSGYGKMLIIDHGQRYYTVYAHLSDLLKRPGDIVQRGEPIALVGDSDSLAGARLYFEIRKDGKPLDPLPWFKRR